MRRGLVLMFTLTFAMGGVATATPAGSLTIAEIKLKPPDGSKARGRVDFFVNPDTGPRRRQPSALPWFHGFGRSGRTA